MDRELNLGIGFAVRYEKERNLLAFEPRQRPADTYGECSRMTIDLLDFLKQLGVTAKALNGYAKSIRIPKDPKPINAKAINRSSTMAEIIGEDTSDANPYSAFWKILNMWPRAQAQRAKEAAVHFRKAVDSGLAGARILEAAEALLAATQYVSRLDLWLASEGYRPFLDIEVYAKPAPTVCPVISVAEGEF